MEIKIKDYSALIPHKITGIISLIIENKKIDFFESLCYLYQSELHGYLIDETTKLWHLSPNKLFDLLEDEKKKGKFAFCDFV